MYIIRIFIEYIMYSSRTNRNRRPPTDKVNALLSLAYTLLASDVTAALETVGLDAYVGFFAS